ncbi:MAG: hypothetical protein AAFQ80_16360 [Cyanobacteria bacterium J06621_8]
MKPIVFKLTVRGIAVRPRVAVRRKGTRTVRDQGLGIGKINFW